MTSDKLSEERRNILRDIIAERQRQEQTWGEQNHINCFWYAILGEEVGEVADHVQRLPGYGNRIQNEPLREELIQVAAVVFAWLECMERNNDK